MAGRILIADPTATNRIILKVKLTAARYTTLQAADGETTLALARAERPDLVILSAQLDGIGGLARLGTQNAEALCAALKTDPRTRAIPVLIIDAMGDRANRLAALKAGADEVLTKPLDEHTLLALVRHLMRTRATFDELARRQDTIQDLGLAEPAHDFTRPARVVVIAAAPEAGLVWRRDLGRRLDIRVRQLDKAQALGLTDRRDAPDAFVIAADIAGPGDGLRLVSELRSRAASRHAAIVIQDEVGAPETVPMALDLGADAVVSGRFDAGEVATRLGTLINRKRETDALRDSLDRRLGMAVRDPLTGLYNRRYAETYLTRVATESSESGQPFAVMMLDLDRFKTVNDSCGHRVGDEVLIETAERLKANLREIDLVARHGGEEFLVAMPETDLDQARSAAERLREVIGEAPMRPPSQDAEVWVTVSIGVTVCRGEDVAAEMSVLIDQADTALYASKTDGRNLVTLSGHAAA